MILNFHQNQWEPRKADRIYFADEMHEGEKNLEDAIPRGLNQAIETIELDTQAELIDLRQGVEQQKRVNELQNTTPPEDPQRLKAHLEAYQDALNDRYFEKELIRGGDDFALLARDLQEQIKVWMDQNIQVLLEEKGGEYEIQTLKQDLHQIYQGLARLDGRGEFISVADLEKIEALTGNFYDQVDAFLEQDNTALLTDIRNNTPEKWEEILEMQAQVILEKVEAEGLEDRFSKLVAAQNGKETMNFRRAKRLFMEEFKRQDKISLEQGQAYFDDFNRQLFEPFVAPEVQAFEKYKDSSFLAQIKRESQSLLGGRSRSPDPDIQMMVDYLRAKPHERQRLQADPAQRARLFRGIAKSEVYGKKMPYIPKKTTTSRDPEHPTGNDRAARQQSIAIFGEQAKALVAHYEPGALNEMEGMDLSQVDTPIYTDFKIAGVVNAKTHPRFRSKLQQGGFSMQGLLLKGGKLAGYIALGANVLGAFNSEQAKDEKTLLGRLGKTVELTAKSPAAWLAGGTAYLTGEAEKDPRLLKLPFASRYEQRDMIIERDFRKVREKVGYKRVSQFKADKTEWDLMKKLTPEKISRLNAVAKKHYRDKVLAGEKPGRYVLTPQMFEEANVFDNPEDKALVSHLNPRLNHTRYLMYNHLLGGGNFNVQDIENHIESNPS